MRAATFALTAFTVTSAVNVGRVRSPGYVGPRGRIVAKPVTGLCDNVTQEAGYFEIDTTTNKNYFYWYFESRSSPSTDPVAIWMTGGPGCSSMVALLTENGPCQMSGSSTAYNPYSWNSNSNILWIDQPGGTGFSYTDAGGRDTDEAGVARDMYAFLQAFFKQHTELQGRPFFITGESYGGHYVPAVSNIVFQNNKNLAAGDVWINLQGLAIGNGLTNPLVQYQYYAEQAYNFSMSYLGKPAITLRQYEAMVAAWPACEQRIATCQTNTNSCSQAESSCNNAMFSAYESTGLDVYDMRRPCGPYPLCSDMGPITDFLNSAETQAALGVTGVTWEPCNNAVNGAFQNDWMKTFHQVIPDLLANGTRAMIYAGDVDFICNWLGNQAWVRALDWPGKDEFNAAPVTNWTATGGGDAVGTVQTAGPLSFARVFLAGHMVPSDQPAAALTLFNTFISNGTLPA